MRLIIFLSRVPSIYMCRCTDAKLCIIFRKQLTRLGNPFKVDLVLLFLVKMIKQKLFKLMAILWISVIVTYDII